jgi:hypothetical protein
MLVALLCYCARLKVDFFLTSRFECLEMGRVL